MTCEHKNFGVNVGVNRLVSPNDRPMQFVAEISIRCADCDKRFQFLGLRAGLDLQGARVSIDGMEAALAIAPEGSTPNPLDRMSINHKGSLN